MFNQTHKKNCCYQCEKREVGCHSKCKDYQEFKAKNEQTKAERLKSTFKRAHTIKILDNAKFWTSI